MKRTSMKYVGLFLPALVALIVTQGVATTIDPAPFEVLVSGADLVAILECRTGGGITALYRVREVFKGDPKSGDELILRVPPNQYGPVFPETLASEVYLVTAWKKGNEAPSNITSTSFAGSSSPPPTFRDFHYSVPLFQGRFRLKETATGSYEFATPQPPRMRLTFPEARQTIEKICKSPGGGNLPLFRQLQKIASRMNPGREPPEPQESREKPSGEWEGYWQDVALARDADEKTMQAKVARILEFLEDLPNRPRIKDLILDLSQVSDSRILPALLKGLAKVPEPGRSEYHWILARLGMNPKNREMIEKAMIEGLNLPQFQLPAAPQPPGSNNSNKFGIPRERQEQAFQQMIAEFQKPAEPDPNVLNMLIQQGMSREEAVRKSPPRWIYMTMEIRMLDADLRGKIGQVLLPKIDSLDDLSKSMALGNLAFCPNPEIAEKISSLLDSKFGILSMKKTGFKEERELGPLLESLGGLAEASPEKAMPFFLKLPELPEERSGMFWLDSARVLAKGLPENRLGELLAAPVSDFRVVAGAEAVSRKAGQETLGKVRETMKSLGTQQGTIFADEANLVLAEDGNLESVPRLFEVFRPLEKAGTIFSHRQLVCQIRTMIGLMNLASKRQIPDISGWYAPEGRTGLKKSWADWWEKNVPTVSSSDLQAAFKGD